MTSKEAIENIRNGKFITCKVCDNNYNQWLTGCMCCRNQLSKSKELDIIEKDLEMLEIIKKHKLLNYVLKNEKCANMYHLSKEEIDLLREIEK